MLRGSVASEFRVEHQSDFRWDVHIRLPEPVDFLGYSMLRLAFHPGDATGTTLRMFVGSYRFRLAGRGGGQFRVDLNRAEWQILEIPLELLQREQIIDEIVFRGDLDGSFYIDDMRFVVANAPPAATAVADEDEPLLPQTIPETPALEQNYPNIPFKVPSNFSASSSVRGRALRRIWVSSCCCISQTHSAGSSAIS